MNNPLIKDIRGRGLMNTIEIDRDSNVNGHDFCDIMIKNGILTKATKDYSVRFTPPLVITKEEVD